jgi:hypothetical protein
MFVSPTYAPVERLIANTTAFVRENPGNAQGYYTLARIHYLAFANKAFLVGATDLDSPPRIAPDWLLGDFAYYARRQRAMELTLQEFGCSSASHVAKTEQPKFWNVLSQKEKELQQEGWEHEKPNEKELAKHAAASVCNFKQAIKLDPQNGLYYLGLASLLDQYVQWLREIELDYVPEEFRSIILNRAKDIYYTAYDLSIHGDLKNKYLPLPGLHSMVGYEAGKAYIRLSEADESIPKGERNKIPK